MKFYESGEYRATKDWPHSLCAGAALYRYNNGVVEVCLLFSNKSDTDNNPNFKYKSTYHLPKGHVGLGEKLDGAAQREVQEETGCSSNITTYLGLLTWDYVHPRTKFMTIKTACYFAAELGEETGPIDGEHEAKVWVSLDEAEKLLGKPNPKGEDEIIRRLKKFLEISK